ncbi:MAG: hypothetical protein ACLFVQ_04165 [Chitinispirillaceae bacterium]
MKTRMICVLSLLCFSSTVYSDYFLSWPQKGDLLLTGAVSDTSGNRYNVRIVPGFLNVGCFGGDQWSDGWSLQKKGGIRFAYGLLRIPVSVKHLGGYFTPKPWKGIGNGFEHFIEGEKFLFTEFMWLDVGETWVDYYGKAHSAMERQSFAWWLAYPWATMKGTVNTTLRYTFGLVGATGVAVYGFALRPAWELSLPVLKMGAETVAGTAHATYAVLETSWGLGVNQLLLGSAVPVSGYVWNTAVGVPLAFLGRAPTPGSADGWWVVMMNGSKEEKDPSLSPVFPSEWEVNKLLEWQVSKIIYNKEYRRLLEKRDAQLDPLYAEIESIRSAFNDSVSALKSRIPVPGWNSLPPRPRAAVWEEEDREKLVSLFLTSLEKNVRTTLTEEEKKQIASGMASYWLVNHYRSSRSRSSSPMDPNRLIQDEIEEIFRRSVE